MSSRSSSSAWLSQDSFLISYAERYKVSSDGCRSATDVEYRNIMLKNLTKGHENGWLK